MEESIAVFASYIPYNEFYPGSWIPLRSVLKSWDIFLFFCSPGNQIQALAQSGVLNFIYLFILFDYIPVPLCVCTCMWGRGTHPCDCTCRRPKVEVTYLQRRHSPLSTLFSNSRVELELYRSERLAAPWDSGILLSPPPQCWHHRCMPPGLYSGCWAHVLIPTQQTLYPLSCSPRKLYILRQIWLCFQPGAVNLSTSVSHQ